MGLGTFISECRGAYRHAAFSEEQVSVKIMGQKAHAFDFNKPNEGRVGLGWVQLQHLCSTFAPFSRLCAHIEKKISLRVTGHAAAKRLVKLLQEKIDHLPRNVVKLRQGGSH